MSPNQNVTASAVVQATVKYNNFDDPARVYDIMSNVEINGKTVSAFNGGLVRHRPVEGEQHDPMTEGEGSPAVGEFSAYGTHSLTYTAHNIDAEESVAVLTAVYAFMADVKASVQSN